MSLVLTGTSSGGTIASSTSGVAVQMQDSGANTNTCQAWANFNGVSGSVAIRASFNISSITRNAAGNYTLAFTNALVDSNYASVVTGATGDTYNVAIGGRYTTSTASAIQVSNAAAGTGGVDVSYVSVAVFR